MPRWAMGSNLNVLILIRFVELHLLTLIASNKTHIVVYNFELYFYYFVCMRLPNTLANQILSQNIALDSFELHIGRGLLAKIISLRGTHVGNTWFGVYLKGI
jgi:hypothetical protein